MRQSRRFRSALFAWAAVSLPHTALAQSPSPPVPAPPGPVVTAAASETARDVLARVRPSILQVKGFFGSNSAPAFHGTGFAIGEGGLFVTNYHVVAEWIHHPRKFRLEYQTADGKTGKIAVLAADVRHDLALVRATSFEPAPLKLATGDPIKGARAYAVGYPLDVGLTITEGVSNGKVEDSFDPRIHYSGAINGGMSGGPALNAAGEVIGVNVSGYRFQQLVSFLVPGAHVEDLRTFASPNDPSAEALTASVQAQLRAHSQALLTALNKPMLTQKAAGFVLPAKLDGFIDCNATGNPASTDPVQAEQIQCAAKAGLYLQAGLSGGDVKYAHFVLSTEKLDAWRFAGRLSQLTQARGAFGIRRHVGAYACEDRVVGLKGFDAAVLVCARGYRKFAGLYDFTVRVSSLNGARTGFASHLDLFGLEYAPSMAFIQAYLDAMEWKP